MLAPAAPTDMVNIAEFFSSHGKDKRSNEGNHGALCASLLLLFVFILSTLIQDFGDYLAARNTLRPSENCSFIWKRNSEAG